MMRRRMMMQDRGAPTDWDVMWDYSMGMPEDNGFTIEKSGNPIVRMEENGLYVDPASGYVRFSPKDYPTCKQGIYEVELEAILWLTSPNGFRMILSDGEKGVQIYANGSRIDIVEGIVHSTIYTGLSNGTTYTFRIEKIDGENVGRVFLDGEEIYATKKYATEYTVQNYIYFQTSGRYLFKAARFKKIS